MLGEFLQRLPAHGGVDELLGNARKELEFQMVVQSLEFFWGQVPVDCRFSYGRVEAFPVVLVAAQDQSHIGWGEVLGAPEAPFFELARQLIGCPLEQVDELIERIAGPSSWSLLESISMACHDLRARISNRPLHQLFGRLRRNTIPLMPCIFPQDVEHAATSAARFHSQGFQHLKVKLLGDLQQDIATVRAIRSAAKGIALQGDANEGYALGALMDGALHDLKRAGLDLIEDPCAGTPGDYARLKSESHPSIMIDVMARPFCQLQAALEQRCVDVVNLHPCQQVTLTRAVRKAQLCESWGVPVVIGGTGYVGIGSAAYQQLAGVVGVNGPCGELGGEVDHGMPPGLCQRPKIQDGAVKLPESAGHGAVPNFKALEPFFHSKRRLS